MHEFKMIFGTWIVVARFHWFEYSFKLSILFLLTIIDCSVKRAENRFGMINDFDCFIFMAGEDEEKYKALLFSLVGFLFLVLTIWLFTTLIDGTVSQNIIWLDDITQCYIQFKSQHTSRTWYWWRVIKICKTVYIGCH